MGVSLRDTRSEELYSRARQYLPGGVNSPVRAMGAIGRDPIFIERGVGAEITDVDGNTYVDYVCSWGPLILGHANPAVVEAIDEVAAGGTTFGAPTAIEVDLAEEVSRRVPGIEMMRMTSSGTEAAMSAIRLARAATGRTTLLKFAGAYHGHLDGLLAQAGSGLATQSLPTSPGVPEAATAATVVVPWNDPDAVREAVGANELAAILVEPYPANMGLVPPQEGFLELLRELADESGALLAAGLATLRQLDEAAYARLSSTTETLADGLRAGAQAAGVPVEVVAVTGLVTVFFSDRPVTDYAGAQACDTERYGAWCRELLARGVYPPPSQFEAWFPSIVHDSAQLDLTIEAAAAAFSEVA